jgi:hypothetical protein
MEPFEKDPEIARRTAKVLEALRKKSRSESIRWEVLEVAAEAGRDTNQGRYIIEKARLTLLREDGIKAECRDRGIGVYLMTETEQVKDCARQRLKRARGQVGRGIKEVGSVWHP